MLDVVILTDERFIQPKKTDEFTTNTMFEDQLVTTELIKLGLAVKKVAWSDITFDWKSTKYVLFRTPWDYHERFDEFSDWLIRVAFETKLINSYDLISWNLDKHYLNDLKRSGLNIVETYFIEPLDSRSLSSIHQELGWGKIVLKPTISASAKDTHALTPDMLASYKEIYAQLIQDQAMMVQPFQDNIIKNGEMSLMLVGGKFTHAVNKKAKEGDFRVQNDFGGTVEDYEPNQEEIDLAIKAVEACETTPVYARVDLVADANNLPAIMELEIIEPEMWFRKNPEAAKLLAAEIAQLFRK
jgi:glutathione synthase/RimK-type ligase-like ATP-grasp enzyme